MTRVLLVEDSDEHADIVTRALTGAKKGVTVVRAMTVKEAMLHAALKHFDIAVVDYRLPDGDGIDLLDSLRAQSPGLPVLFLTAHGTEEVAMQAMSRGAADYLVKGPRYQRELPQRVEDVLARSEDLARMAAAVRHSAEAAPIPAQPRSTAPPPKRKAAPAYDARTLGRLVRDLVTEQVTGAAVFDEGGAPVAARLPSGIDAAVLGASLVGLQGQASAALRSVPGAGPPRAFLAEYDGGLLAAAAVPGPTLVVLLLSADTDPRDGLRRAQDAGRRVWDASGGS